MLAASPQACFEPVLSLTPKIRTQRLSPGTSPRGFPAPPHAEGDGRAQGRVVNELLGPSN